MTSNKETKQTTGPVIRLMFTAFLVLTGAIFLLRNFLAGHGTDYLVILGGNLILFLVAVFTLGRSVRAVYDPNPHVFVRVFYSGFLIRLAVIAVAAFFYIYTSKGTVSRPALFICLGIYALYAILETSALRKILREKQDA